LPRVSVSPRLYLDLRRGGGGRRKPSHFRTETTTMLGIGLILNALGIGLICWLIFELTVYALPFLVAVTVGTIAWHSDAGVAGALLAGFAMAALTLAIGQLAFALARPMILRGMVASVFAIPAAIAGYHLIYELSRFGVPSLLWRQVCACTGAIFIAATAWTRITVLAPPRPEPGRAGRNKPQPVPTTATREG
jgi:hypothetical protein